MKKNKIFFTIACILTLGFATIATDAIGQGRTLPSTLTHWGEQSLNEDIEAMALSYARELDPDYEIITFEDNAPTELRNMVEQAVEGLVLESRHLLEDDSNFQFKASYKKESAGNLDGDALKNARQATKVETLEQQIMNHLGWDYGSEQVGYTINPLPAGFTFEYTLKDPLVNDGGYVASFIDYDSYMMPCILLAACVPLALIGLFVLLFPYKDEKEAPLVRKTLQWKLEPSILFYGTLFTFLFMGVILLSQASLMDGKSLLFDGLLQGNIYKALYTLLWFVWSLVYGSYFLVLVYLKRIFCEGIGRFIQRDTWLFGIIHWVQGKTDALFALDLGRHNLDKIVIAMVASLVVVSILFAIAPLGWIVAMLLMTYGFIKFFQYYKRIKADYEKTLAATRQIAAGDFDKVLPYPVGPFQSIYNTLLQVKSGFEIALKKGIQSQNMKTELISNVSHDLKTPLTGIKTYVELLETTDDPQKHKEYGQKIEGYTNRLDQLVVDLFDVSKANSGNIQLERQPVDLVELIGQVQAEHLDEWEKKDLQVVYKHPDHPVTLLLDPNKSMRVFENLIGNISKYAMDNTRVFIDVKEEADTVTITYRNISSQPLDFDPDEIVERFVRGDKSRHEIGSGLGLAIVKSFTEIQNGEFKIDIDGDLFKAIVTFKK
nr:sensor histidine kinase [uncultured Dubosiella sp.]